MTWLTPVGGAGGRAFHWQGVTSMIRAAHWTRGRVGKRDQGMSVPRGDRDDRAGLPAGGPAIHSLALPTGVRIEYVEQGESTGSPVVLLHGFTDSWRSFELVLPHLPASIRAFALSQRGHGDAERPPAEYGPRSFAADLAAFLDAQDLKQAVIVGHSMSTIIAQRFALDYAERTQGLVLMSWRGYPRESAVAALVSLTDPIDPGFIRQFHETSHARPVPQTYLQAMVQESLKVPARVWHAIFTDFPADDFSAELGTIAVPTLIVWGDQDVTCPRHEQEALAAIIPGARLAVYTGAGHTPHWEEPERFAADLVAFVEQVAGS